MPCKERVLIGDDSPEFGKALAGSLAAKGLEVQVTSNDGAEIYRSIAQNHASIVIINSTPENIDAARLIARVNAETDSPPFFYVANTSYNETLERKLLLHENTYMISLPFDYELFSERIATFSLRHHKENSNMQKSKAEQYVTELIRQIGIPANLRGYYYIRYGVVELSADSTLGIGITKRLYPHIARFYKATPQRVERAIRNAIEYAWADGEKEICTRLFGNILKKDKERPTNAQFINSLADAVNMYLRH